MRAVVALLLVGLAGPVFAGDQPLCIPGAQVECACPGGLRGVQVCEEGTHFAPCQCAQPAAPPPQVAPQPEPQPPAVPQARRCVASESPAWATATAVEKRALLEACRAANAGLAPSGDPNTQSDVTAGHPPPGPPGAAPAAATAAPSARLALERPPSRGIAELITGGSLFLVGLAVMVPGVLLATDCVAMRGGIDGGTTTYCANPGLGTGYTRTWYAAEYQPVFDRLITEGTQWVVFFSVGGAFALSGIITAIVGAVRMSRYNEWQAQHPEASLETILQHVAIAPIIGPRQQGVALSLRF